MEKQVDESIMSKHIEDTEGNIYGAEDGSAAEIVNISSYSLKRQLGNRQVGLQIPDICTIVF